MSHKKNFVILTLLIVGLWLGTSLVYRDYTLSSRAQFTAQKTLAYDNKIELTVDRYHDFSAYLFDTLIDEHVRALLAQAMTTDEAIKDTARTDLYAYLLEDYDTIERYNFRQLHFHLPNGDSFLRFHAPMTYGDNLFDVRSSIRRANTDLTPQFGFEEGRVYNGYRFVYPIFHESEHVGSVEISISIATILDTLFTVEPTQTHHFLIRRSVVEALVFDEYLENYRDSALCSDLLYDLAVSERFTDRRQVLEGDALSRFLSAISQDVNHLLDSGENFSHYHTFEGVPYSAHFVALTNIDHEHVGYVFTIWIDTEYQSMIFRDNLSYFAIGGFYSVMLIAALSYSYDKERIRKLSQTDDLTKLFNRRYFLEMAEKELNRAQRLNQKMSLILMDIDHFKTINDQFGHFMGDKVLIKIGQIMNQRLRKYDTVARWGGEEFSILLPQTDKNGAVAVVKKIQQSLLELSEEIEPNVTMSFGVICTNEASELEALLRLADQKLYQAKADGRNRYII